MKISWFKTNISPEIGSCISGYCVGDVATSKLNDLFMTGLLADDGERKVLLISFDLLCLDRIYILKYRKLCGEILNIPPEAVMLTFTHTHGGPQTNTEPGKLADLLDSKYLDKLENLLRDECKKLISSPQNLECDVFFYSNKVDANKNRRVVTADNYAAYIPCRAELRNCADGFTDQELGSILFFPRQSSMPAYVIGNYASHPLAAHTPGSGGFRISADYPGFFRDYVTAETGAECMFVTGACGDLFPHKDELGSEGAKQMGIQLAEGVFRAMLDVQRNTERFQMTEQKVGAICRSIRVPLRPFYRNNEKMLPKHDLNDDHIELEIQCLSIGNTCFIGVPGEWCSELGAEVKWHSAFRKTFIAFAATAYNEYICPGNFLLQGGYEARHQHFPARYSIDMVKLAVDATYELRDILYPLPEDCEEDSSNSVNQFKIQVKGMPIHQSFPFE